MRRHTRPRAPRGRSRVGERFVVECERIAHGGFVVARHDGVVVFVRHALPGERVEVVVTEGEEGSRFLRADTVSVLSASPDRVVAPCQYAGWCGGCDFQHVSLPAQRALKATVVSEQLRRLAGLDVDVVVEDVGGGLGWRTRVQYSVAAGRAGLRASRSHEVVPIDRCLIAHPDLPEVLEREWPSARSVEAIVSSRGERLRVVDGVPESPGKLHERVGDTEFEITGAAFWQVHPNAAVVLREAVLTGVEARPGERVLDLYAGVGLFAEALGRAVGEGGGVVAVEADRGAAVDAEANLAAMSWVEVSAMGVESFLGLDELDHRAQLDHRARLDHRDVVVLDPPRTGAKRAVVEAVAGLGPRVVAYVACDPAALARDVATFAERGYQMASLRAFDLFPMTHHVECVAVLHPASGSPAGRVGRPHVS